MNPLYILAVLLGLALFHLIDNSGNKKKEDSYYGDRDLIHEQNLMQENDIDDTDQLYQDNILNEEF
jgi:hypothetical protein